MRGGGEGIITQFLLQDIEASGRMEGEGGLSTEDFTRKESIKFDLVNKLQIEEIS